MVDSALQAMQFQMHVMQQRQGHMVRAMNWMMSRQQGTGGQATGGDDNEEEEEEEEEEESSEEESSASPSEEQPPGHMPRPGQPFLNTHLHNQCA